MGYSIDPISANCYFGTTSPMNKFDFREEEKLSEAEGVLTAARYAEWLSAPKVEPFDFDHYKVIHRVRLGRRGAHSQYQLERRSFWVGLSHDEFVNRFAEMDADLLMIATIQSARGVIDLLRTVFSECIF